MTRALAILALLLTAGARAATPDAAAAPAAATTTPVPGIILVQTAREGATLAPAGKDAKAQALKPGQTIAASGQLVDMQENAPVELVLSNGDSFYFPLGGRLTLDEFTQDPITDSSHNDRDYEPSRSSVRLNFSQGTLVASNRKPVPTSTLTLTTPLARFECLSPSFVVLAGADSVTFVLLEGTAEVNIPETGFHDTLQAGQSATLTKAGLKANYPLKLANITTADNQKYAAWLAAARMAERRVTFTGPAGHLLPHTQIAMEFTQQMSVDDPRIRQ
jgi:hypothetical protein